MKNMTKHKLRKLEKKRRAEKQKRKLEKTPPLAYYGSKYRSEKYVPIMLATELAINETSVVSDYNLTDAQVASCLTELICQLRKGPLPELENLADEEIKSFSSGDYLSFSIISHWRDYFRKNGSVSKDSLVGVLRTILASIEFHRSGTSKGRGYLEFLHDFLAHAGAGTQLISEEELEQLEIIEE